MALDFVFLYMRILLIRIGPFQFAGEQSRDVFVYVFDPTFEHFLLLEKLLDESLILVNEDHILKAFMRHLEPGLAQTLLR